MRFNNGNSNNNNKNKTQLFRYLFGKWDEEILKLIKWKVKGIKTGENKRHICCEWIKLAQKLFNFVQFTVFFKTDKLKTNFSFLWFSFTIKRYFVDSVSNSSRRSRLKPQWNWIIQFLANGFNQKIFLIYFLLLLHILKQLILMKMDRFWCCNSSDSMEIDKLQLQHTDPIKVEKSIKWLHKRFRGILIWDLPKMNSQQCEQSQLEQKDKKTCKKKNT